MNPSALSGKQEVVEERELPDAVVLERSTRPREQGRDVLALMPFLTVAALVPLSLLLRARNL